MMQCKDIPDEPILRLLAANPVWHNWFEVAHWNDRSVRPAMPPGTPERLVRAKMARLIRRGLVDGCPCGCRGDFEITDRGRAAVGLPPEPPLSGGLLAAIRGLAP